MKLNKVLRYIALGSIFLIPFIPLVVSNSMFFPFITGKNFAFRILVEIGLAAWILLALRDKEYLPKKSWILWGFASLLVVLALADIGSENPHKSFWSNFERMEGYVTFLHLFAYFIVTSAMLKTRKLWAEFVKIEIVASLLVAFYAFLQLFGFLAIHQGSTRLDATLGNSAYLAVYMLFNVFLLLFLLVRYLKEKQGTADFQVYIPTLLALGALAETMVVYYTATRGALIGLAVALVFVSIMFAIKEQNKLIKRTSIGILAVIVLLGIIFVAARNSSYVEKSPVLSRFSSLATTNIGQILSTDGESRVEIWKMALQGIAERPILGWGQESFNYLFYKYYNPNMYNQEPWFDRAHDVVLDWLVDAGVLGLLAYLSLFAAAIYYLVKNKNGALSFAERTILGGALIGYFIHNIFVFDNITSYILFFTLLAYLHHAYGGNMKEALAKKVTTLSSNTYAITASIIVVAIAIAFYFINVKGIEAATELTQALSTQPGGAAQNLQLYENVIGLNSFGQPEVREYLTQFAIQAATAQGLDQTTLQNIYNFALAQMKQQVIDTPADARYYYFLEHLYIAFGDLNNALVTVQKALTLSPKKQLLLSDLGDIYVQGGQPTLAVPVFKTEYEEAPADTDALISYAMSLIMTGQQTLADSLLIPVYGSDLVQDQRIILAYNSVKDYTKVIAILKAEVAADPTNVQDIVSLATAYYQDGQKTTAISMLKALELSDPADASAIEAYIAQLEGVTPAATSASTPATK